ncbi:hypothetical protein G6F65_022225 [Rhizopus arrhizus]|nr:hypothetical protein G6F65_022225 [Rhizopus arrhizus]
MNTTTRAAGSSRTGRSARRLLTHTNVPVESISGWWLDDAGQLYATTPAGGAIVLDRDLPALLEKLVSDTGAPVLDALADLPAGHVIQASWPDVYPAAPLQAIARNAVAQALGFDPNPRATQD